MTDSLLSPYRQTLDGYAEDLLEATAQRLSRYGAPRKKAPPAERIEQALATPRLLERLLADLEPAEQSALAIFRRSPRVYWRWDHAVRLLAACGIQSPYRVLQSLLTAGVLCMRTPLAGNRLVRFEVPDGLAPEASPLVALAAPLAAELPELPLPVEPLSGQHGGGNWRETDGWELPLRLALLWQLAWQLPIKRTQQQQLFKRDHERIANNPLLSGSMLDAPEPIEEMGLLIYALAEQQGWLSGGDDGQTPTGLLTNLWPSDLNELLLSCATALLGVRHWNELGARTPIGPFAGEVASARFLLLLLLATLAEDEGATCSALAERLQAVHPPWNAVGELVGPFRQPDQRAELAQEWVRRCVLGPLYQCGLVAVAAVPGRDLLVRLSALGRMFVGLPATLTHRAVYPQTLLAQPNHAIIVYRQGLSVDLLARLVIFAEPRSIGAALTFEVTADSVYRALEAGMPAEQTVALLEQQGGRPLPPGLASSIATWSQKRDRVSVYTGAALFEFADEADLKEAMARGLDGIALTDRILLAPGDGERNLSMLRIIASRDYRLSPEPCVVTGPDGVTLHIDREKADLMLEAEILRFAEPLPLTDKEGRRQFRVTPASLRLAFEQGLAIDGLEEWFQRRTGGSPPASVMLLFQAAAGARLVSRCLRIVKVEDPLTADGLLQHPLTADLLGERLGPTAMTVPEEKFGELHDALESLGIELVND